jgi:hypothetical protein
MGTRAHILVKLVEGVDQEGVVQLVRDIEELAEVMFVEPVAGVFDLVINVEAKSSIEEVVEKIKPLAGIEAVEALKINPIFPRERMRKNIAKLPHKAQN